MWFGFLQFGEGTSAYQATVQAAIISVMTYSWSFKVIIYKLKLIIRLRCLASILRHRETGEPQGKSASALHGVGIILVSHRLCKTR